MNLYIKFSENDEEIFYDLRTLEFENDYIRMINKSGFCKTFNISEIEKIGFVSCREIEEVEE